MELGNQLDLIQFTKFFCNSLLPSLFRCSPPLFSDFELMLAWLMSFQLFYWNLTQLTIFHLSRDD